MNKVNKEIYLKLVLDPVLLFLFIRYNLKHFTNIIIKNNNNNNMSDINTNCKLMFKKDNNFGSIKSRKVTVHKTIPASESDITDLKSFNLFNIQN